MDRLWESPLKTLNVSMPSFRYSSILSYHLATSRDIALQLAEQEVLRHFLSGGRWKAPSGDWKQPGPSITKFLGDNTFLTTLLGYGRNATAASHPSGMFSQCFPALTESLSDLFTRDCQTRAVEAHPESLKANPVCAPFF